MSKLNPEQTRQLADAETKLDKARTNIVLDHPFFATILLKREITLSFTAVPTAGVTARGHIYVNPAFIADKTVNQVVFLLCHEVGHVIMDHITRCGARDKKRWNYAGDYVINDLLKASDVGEIILPGLYMDGARDKTTDQVYNELPEGVDYGDGEGEGGIGGDLKDGDDPDGSGKPTQEQIEVARQEMKMEIAQAAQTAKMRGKLPGALSSFAENMIESKVPWYDILERHMVSMVKGEYSWARPNRRFVNAGHYLPSVGKTPQLGTIVVQVDVSGSISPVELAHYDGHLKRIVELCNPETVHVLYVDTAVAKHEQFARGEEFGLRFYSGGGTDMPAGFEYLDKQGIVPEVFVCLTDGYTPWGEDQGYPIVWCVSSDAKPDHGEHVKFDLAE